MGQLAIAHFTIPCETPNIIESKSFKLYLNSFNSTVFTDAQAVRERLRTDLGEALWRGSERSAGIGVRLLAPDAFDLEPVHELDGLDLDRLDIECTHYQPAPELLSSDLTQPPVTETLSSRIVSFRNHNEFHEPCAERIFTDIWKRCQPTQLAVYARYTRRGGLDINPFRTSWPQALPANTRTARQ